MLLHQLWCQDANKQLSAFIWLSRVWQMSHLASLHEDLDCKNKTFELKSYQHYIQVFSDLKDKWGVSGWVVLSWPALQTGSKAPYSTLIICLSKSLLHTVPFGSNKWSLGSLENDNENVVYTDSSFKIPRICQTIWYLVSDGKPSLMAIARNKNLIRELSRVMFVLCWHSAMN